MVTAWKVSNKLETNEYDQTYELLGKYTPNTPQSHQCGFIAQSVQTMDEQIHGEEVGDLGEDGNRKPA